MRFQGIICRSANNVLGKGDSLAWPIKDGDMAFFKAKTMGGNVIMGNKTWTGMNHYQLPARYMFILTKKNTYGFDNIISPKGDKAVNIVENLADLPATTYWVCGGLQIYKLFLDKISEFYVTTLTKEYEGDVICDIDFDKHFKNKETVEKNDKYEVVRYWN